MYIIKNYSLELKKEWDDFVTKSKNGTFLFYRDYMEYHKDRFEDLSFVILDSKKNICAIIPGCISEEVYYTHRGLTYGGIIIDRESKMKDMLQYFEILNNELKERGIKKVVYKCVPNIYHKYPAQEEEYALFMQNANLMIVNISSTIDLEKELKFNKLRKRCISKAKRYNFVMEKDKNYKEFWEILSQNLKITHGATPVHSLDEILKLKENFPENIKLYTAKILEKVVAGVLVYEDIEVAHIQYISANVEGKETSALDCIFDFLIKKEFKNKKYFDFGTSTENNGKYLNEGLIFQKEGFGARGIVYKIYEYYI